MHEGEWNLRAFSTAVRDSSQRKSIGNLSLIHNQSANGELLAKKPGELSAVADSFSIWRVCEESSFFFY